MVKKDLKSRRKLDLLNCLLENPTQSLSKIAEKTNMYRRTAWQIQKELEEDNTIWGYTAVIDEQKIDNVIYLDNVTLTFFHLIYKLCNTIKSSSTFSSVDGMPE